LLAEIQKTMLEELTYFNLIYGACLFVLAIKGTDRDILTMGAFIIVLLFNWVTLKELEGLKITTTKNKTILRISTFVVAFIILINTISFFSFDFDGRFKINTITFLIALRIVFVATISFHALKSRQINLVD
jgi:hypothetical protein